jgi:hypothetical protein
LSELFRPVFAVMDSALLHRLRETYAAALHEEGQAMARVAELSAKPHNDSLAMEELLEAAAAASRRVELARDAWNAAVRKEWPG